MSKWLLVFSMFSGSCIASDIVYLSCDGIAADSVLNQKQNTVKNDFFINKKEKYFQQIITGLTEEQTKSLRLRYQETPTQYVSEDGSLHINRHTLEYSFKGPMGLSINGVCKVLKPSI
ncbi:hypothetical protein ABXV18_16185 [Vibrio owensii]|uniref:hypothetical protein n=1 Tax=Vibrio owensii TaxID=696485 RepID=UPI003394BBDF